MLVLTELYAFYPCTILNKFVSFIIKYKIAMNVAIESAEKGAAPGPCYSKAPVPHRSTLG